MAKKKLSFKQKFVKKIISLRPKSKKGLLFSVLFIFLVGFTTWFLWGIPLPTNLSKDPPVSTKIYDRNGKLIYEIFTNERRTPVKLEDLPPYIKQATIAIEDKDFYNHHGFSLTGIARAAYSTIFQQKLEGGSTLTQQLVKNALLTPERTIRRKVREFILTILVEAKYSKDEILELYLNQIPYGSTAYGIGAASELYFGKEAKDLTLAEATLLAGLPAAPTKFSPFGANPDLAKGRQDAVLRRMVEDGYISQDEADEAESQELHYAQVEAPQAPHFALWIKEQLAEKYGDAVVEQGGLRVTTSLDLDLQDFAQQTVKEEVDKLAKQHVGNGAAIVVRPKTGEILAMVGSKDYFAKDEDGKVNIIFAKRQPGSSIKPFNYLLAIKDKKLTASTVLADIPTCFITIGQEPYCPVNYDGEFHGAIQARFSLGSSFNVPAVRVLALNGLSNFVDFANKMGITTFTDPSNYGLSLTLGGGEVRPYDMAEAYSTLANEGVKVPLISILKVETWRGKVLEETNTKDVEGDRVVDPAPTFIISQILLDNNARSLAFGEHSFLNVSGHSEVSVKTGTTNDRRDNWTAGYTANAAVVTWVGNNDNTPMSGAVSGVSGASPIWNKIMKNVLDKAEKGTYDESEKGHAWPLQPNDVVGANICANTGTLPDGDTADCPQRFEFFLPDTIPHERAFKTDLKIDRVNQTLATDDTPPENIEYQNHLVVVDPLDTTVCLDCTFPMPQVTIRP